MRISQPQAQASAKRLLIFFGEEGAVLTTLGYRDKFDCDSDDWYNWNLVIEEMKVLELRVVKRSQKTPRRSKDMEVPDWERRQGSH